MLVEGTDDANKSLEDIKCKKPPAPRCSTTQRQVWNQHLLTGICLRPQSVANEPNRAQRKNALEKSLRFLLMTSKKISRQSANNFGPGWDLAGEKIRTAALRLQTPVRRRRPADWAQTSQYMTVDVWEHNAYSRGFRNSRSDTWLLFWEAGETGTL